MPLIITVYLLVMPAIFSAHWIGYSEACSSINRKCKLVPDHLEYGIKPIVDKRPVMVGYQAAGAAPFLRGDMVDDPETVATAIRIGHPQSWDLAWKVQKQSGGWFDELSDEEILATQKLLAEREGVFCEPASAASLAGAMRDIKSGKIPEKSSIVCTLTGHGLKDPETAIKQSTAPVIKTEATLQEVQDAILKNIDHS